MNGEAAIARTIFANDVRLFLRGFQRKGWGAGTALGLQISAVAFLHFSAGTVLWAWSRAGALAGGAEFACLFVVLLVLMVALQRSLEVLFNRGDLPMLLASPVPGRVIVATKLADIVITTWWGTALLVIPLCDMAAIRIGARWAWGWLAWPLAVAALAPMALALTLSAVRRIGARRAKTAVQIGSVFVGLFAFLMLQAPNWLRQARGGTDAAQRVLSLFDRPVLNELAAAAAGSAVWLPVLALFAALSLAWGLARLKREFLSGAQAAGGEETPRSHADSRAAAERAWRENFSPGKPWAALVRKELRLLRRDPLLIARSSMNLVMLVPTMVTAVWLGQAAVLIGAALVGSGIVTMTFAGLLKFTDEAPEHAAASPVLPRAAAFARVIVAAIPALVVVLVAGGFLLRTGEWGSALAALAGALFNGISAGWLTVCTAPHCSAEERAANRQPSLIAQFLFVLLLGGVSSGALMALRHGSTLLGWCLVAVWLAIGGAAFLRKAPASEAS